LRIVSLVPSLTELVYELGLGASLVGRTGYCIHPSLLAKVPKIGGTKSVNLKKIRQLAPTHVILNKDENLLADAQALKEFVPHLVVTHPLIAEDNLAIYRQFGEVFDCVPRAQELSDQFAAELALCRAQSWPIKRALYLIWKAPWMTISAPTYIASMLAQVGLEAVGPAVTNIGEAVRYPKFEGSQANAWNADAILFSSEPYHFTDADFAETAMWAPSHVPRRLIDGEMLSWYGPRAIAGLRYLRNFRHALFEQ
jgi:ABC-type Fe3+-hydroxamate transport system substrate-binding protein